MRYEAWSRDKQRYDLQDGYYIQKANPKEFSIYFATYIVFHMNVWFRQNFDVYCLILADNDSCYWIMNDKGTIGGVLIEPNYMNCLFLIPPYSDFDRVLFYLKGIISEWSDMSKNIIVGAVKPDQLKYFLRLGFRAGETRRCMIRPTETFNIEWDDEFEIITPNIEKSDEITQLLHEAFYGGIGYQGKLSIEERRAEVDEYFSSLNEKGVLLNSSTLIYDKSCNQLVGACLISLWEGWANLFDLAVKPSYRGRKLATKMIKSSLSKLKGHYPVLRLFVTLGNDAETVYNKLGFLAGIETTEMYLPRKQTIDII